MAERIYCPIRREWVAALPEERVRQQLVKLMVDALGYPASCLVVEKALAHMPHLASEGGTLPDRRADIVCFAKGIHPKHDLYPLLLVECKAVKLTPAVVNQVVGYNHFLKAFFVAIANQDAVRTGWYDPAIKNYRFVDHLPDWNSLKGVIETKQKPGLHSAVLKDLSL